jgi:hypothetical protein
MNKFRILRYFSSRINVHDEKSRGEKMVITKPHINSSENEEQTSNSSVRSDNLLSSKNNESTLQSDQSYSINTEEKLIDYTQLFKALVKQEYRKNIESENKEKGTLMDEKLNLPNDKAMDSISIKKTGTTSVPVVPENKPIVENIDNKQFTKGDLSDLFAKNIDEDSKSNKLATSMEDVSLSKLLDEGRYLLNRLKNSN